MLVSAFLTQNKYSVRCSCSGSLRLLRGVQIAIRKMRSANAEVFNICMATTFDRGSGGPIYILGSLDSRLICMVEATTAWGLAR